jgi:hypothetical protein
MADDVVEALIVDLLDWLSTSERPYDLVMSAWRTSCPRLPVWEDANDRGLITTDELDGRSIVRATRAGLELLHRSRSNDPRRP